jgi:ADP-ribose pyrophosphatase
MPRIWARAVSGDSPRRLYSGRVVDLDLEQVALPNGVVAQLEIVRHPGGAAIVVVDAEDRVCLLRQYRHAAGGWLWELPAGRLEPDERPLATAGRELAEEAGVTAARWESLGTIVSSPGVFTEAIHLFLAQDLGPSEAVRDRDEVFEVVWVARDDAVRRALAGDIRDAKTIIGLLRADARLGPAA